MELYSECKDLFQFKCVELSKTENFEGKKGISKILYKT